MTVAVVVAGGSGVRLGGAVPKALVEVAGRRLVSWSVAALAAAATIDHLVVVTAPDDRGAVADALARDGAPEVSWADGGPERRDSVRAGLEACPAGTAVVAVHDAARPLVRPELIDATVGALVHPWVAVAPGVPVTDTLKLVDPDRDGAVVRTVDRRALWAVQTPQVFAFDELRRAHDRIDEAVTDDLGLIEAAGGRVRVVPGDRTNIKVTYPDDLAVCTALLGSRR